MAPIYRHGIPQIGYRAIPGIRITGRGSRIYPAGNAKTLFDVSKRRAGTCAPAAARHRMCGTELQRCYCIDTRQHSPGGGARRLRSRDPRRLHDTHSGGAGRAAAGNCFTRASCILERSVNCSDGDCTCAGALGPRGLFRRRAIVWAPTDSIRERRRGQRSNLTARGGANTPSSPPGHWRVPPR